LFQALSGWKPLLLWLKLAIRVTVDIGRVEKEKKLSPPAYAAFVENFKTG
jgi:hypothetical protein